jgi:uncharacterized protein (TIGR03437 family)
VFCTSQLLLWAACLPVATQSLLQLPEYSAESTVNAASQTAGRIAPNSIFTVYGRHLSLATWALSASDIRNGNLPTDVPGLNVSVLVRGIPVPLYYVSPTQINALIPANFTPGPARLEITRGIARGPRIDFEIVSEAPDIFMFEDGFAAATHPDGRTITPDAPVAPGQYAVIYGTAWGAVQTSLTQQHIAASGALLRKWPDVRLWIEELELAWPAVFYAGLTPGFAGLYQINVRLPDNAHELARDGVLELLLDIAATPSARKVKIPVTNPANATQSLP